MRTKTGQVDRWAIAALAVVAVLLGLASATRASRCADGDGCGQPALAWRVWLPLVASDQSGAPVRPVPSTPTGNGP